MPSAKATAPAKATLSPKAMPSEVAAVPEAGTEPEPEPWWVKVHPWPIGRIKVRVVVWVRVVVRGIHGRRRRPVDSRRWRWRWRHDLLGSGWHRRTWIGRRRCIRNVRSSKLLAVGIPLRLVGPNIAGGYMAPPDLSGGWTCGPHQQPDAEENRYQSCHMLSCRSFILQSNVREAGSLPTKGGFLRRDRAYFGLGSKPRFSRPSTCSSRTWRA